jgi:hypothetical protein
MLPLSGRPARVLCECAGIPPQEGSVWSRYTWALYERFECTNLIRRYEESTPWPRVAARDAASRLMGGSDAAVIVCLGRRVGDAFGFHGVEYGDWTTGSRPIVVAPHPSGRSRLLNAAESRQLLGRILRQAMTWAEMRAA